VGNRWKLVDVEHWDCYRDDAVVNTPITKASCLYFEISASSGITEVCCVMSHYNHKAHMSVAHAGVQNVSGKSDHRVRSVK